LPNCFRVAKPLSRCIMVFPSNRESSLRGSKSTSQNVIESVEIVSPRRQVHYTIDLVVEFLQGSKAFAVDFIGFHRKTKKLAQKEKAIQISLNGLCFYAGDDLRSHTLSRAVPSALRGLTSVFGMGTGGSPAVRSPTNLRRFRGV